VSAGEPLALSELGAPSEGSDTPHGFAWIAGRVRSQIRERPLAAAAASLCAGFALGGGVRRELVALLFGVGARALAARLEDSFLERAPGDSRAQEDER
jgi:hypothetical protein